MIAADGNDSCVSDGTLHENDQLSRARSDVGEADAEFAFVGAKDGISRSQRFEVSVRFRSSAGRPALLLKTRSGKPSLS